MKIKLASEKDISEIELLISDCIAKMREENILQWDEKYPNRRTFQEGIENNQLNILVEKKEIIGIVIINTKQNSGWGKINWHLPNENILVVHSLAIKVDRQRKGNGEILLNYCENYAKENGYQSIRLDVFSGNEGALQLYKSHGYIFTGEIEYLFKPIGHQLYYCFEKKMGDRDTAGGFKCEVQQ